MSVCDTEHDFFATLLSSGLIVGLVLSYLPQHVKIIAAGQSEGLSPWFLLLGSTSSSAAMLNMYTLQLPVLRCCKVVGGLRCIESLLGIVQVSLQWALFSIIFVLYIIYFPKDKKYVKLVTFPGRPPVTTEVRTEEWRISIVLAWITALHFVLSAAYTIVLLVSSPVEPYPTPQVDLWALFLGVSAALLAVVQYLPQIFKTYHARLVGALSIPMMLIQTPGAVVMVTSIALRKGTNWTSWVPFAASGTMQGILLIMCIVWRSRQRSLGIDDFGNPVTKLNPDPLDDDIPPHRTQPITGDSEAQHRPDATEDTPLLQGSTSAAVPTKKKSWWSIW